MASADVENVQQLLAELERVKARLSLYETTKAEIKDQEEKQRKHARKVFRAFDTDNSGDIDADEFQQLSFMLGDTLTKQEVNKIIKELDKDNSNTVNFEEFYAWWSSDDRQKLKDSRTEEQNKQLALLKAKLTSKTYMKTAIQMVDAVKKVAASNSAAPEKSNVSSSLQVTVGKFDEPDASFNLVLRKDPETVQAELKKAKVQDGGILVTVSFLAKEGIDQFELGEFVGRISFALTAASAALKEDSKKIKFPKASWFKEGDQLGFTIYAAIGTDMHKDLPKIFEFQDLLQIENVALNLSLNKRPSPDAKLDDEGIAIKVNAKAAANRPALLKLAGEAKLAEAKALELALSLLTARVDAEFDDTDYLVQYFPKEFIKFLQKKDDNAGSDDEKEKPLPKLNWGLPKALITPLWVDLLTDRRSKKDEINKVAYEVYSKAVSTLESLHTIKVVGGSTVIEGKFENFDVFSVLPTEEEIQARVNALKK